MLHLKPWLPTLGPAAVLSLPRSVLRRLRHRWANRQPAGPVDWALLIGAGLLLGYGLLRGLDRIVGIGG